MTTQSSKINKKGMVTIPYKIREKFDLHEGTEVAFVVEEGSIVLVPLLPIEKIRKSFPTAEEMMKTAKENRKLELQLEQRD